MPMRTVQDFVEPLFGRFGHRVPRNCLAGWKRRMPDKQANHLAKTRQRAKNCGSWGALAAALLCLALASTSAADNTIDESPALREVAHETGADANQVIISWMRQSDPPVLPIIAGSRPEQLRQDMAALELRLTDEQMQRLNTAGNPEIKKAWLR
jgi:aryl-alcohol dehydrogenase-like predicted oxidoreductase